MKLWTLLKPDHKRRKSRTENGSFREDESDGELAQISSATLDDSGHMRSKSVPVDLALVTGTKPISDTEESFLRSSSNGLSQDTSSSTPVRQSPTANARQSAAGRPSGRPASLPTSRNGADKFLSSSQSKKKSGNWFTMSYKQKSEEFHKLFKDIPADERLLVDYSCAMQKDLLVHGRLYISQNWICFYASILFKWETTVMIPCNQIKSITKEKTALVIPNAIQINSGNDKYFFSSFTSRDKAYLMMFRVWQNVLLGTHMSGQQLWTWIHHLYGSQLGLTASDDDYQVPDSDAGRTPDVLSIAGSEEAAPTTISTASISPAAMSSSETLPAENGVNGLSEVPHNELSSDTTEDDCDEGMVECPEGHEHANWTTLDRVVNLSVDQLFDLLFSDNTFFRGFLDSQRTTDIVLGEWYTDSENEGEKLRNNSFTIAINASFGPKSTSSTEKQVLRKECKPGSYYCVDCESHSDPSLPYGDNFYVWNRYCISRLSKNSCHVVVRSKICYRKSVFSLARAIIEKNVRNGVNGYFKPLTDALAQESERVAASMDQPRKKRFTKHRPASVHNKAATRLPNGAVASAKPSSTDQQSSQRNSTERTAYITSTVRVMSALLIFLVMFNLLLFFKLWSLEARHEAMQLEPVSNSEMYSHQDLLALLNKQKHLYEKDISHWKSTLDSSTKVITQLQHSIEEIKIKQSILSGDRVEHERQVSPSLSVPDREPKVDL